ncbi:phage major capsid protein [Natronococcus roseus]|uniref:phage major capsid protein n=1 Tax=Natronococcus roseus TaxID=1052014 RepID=UPI00374CE949
MPETDVNYDGVPTANDVQALIEENTEDLYQFRNAFREDTEASNRDGDGIEYPESGDFEGELVEIEKGSEYPRAKLDYEGTAATHTKYGFEAPIADEDVKDSKVNIVLENQTEMAREEERRLDSIAFNVLEANADNPEVGDSEEPLNYYAGVDAYTTLADHGYDTGNIVTFVSPGAWGDMAKSGEFVTETERFAEELRSTGPDLGEIMGQPAMLTNTGALGPHEALMVDTSSFGWESIRDEFGVSSYREESKDQEVYKLSGRADWVPTDGQAAVPIAGGADTGGA